MLGPSDRQLREGLAGHRGRIDGTSSGIDQPR